MSYPTKILVDRNGKIIGRILEKQEQAKNWFARRFIIHRQVSIN